MLQLPRLEETVFGVAAVEVPVGGEVDGRSQLYPPFAEYLLASSLLGHACADQFADPLKLLDCRGLARAQV